MNPDLSEYPHHFKIMDYLENHELNKSFGECCQILLDKVKSERLEEHFKNNIWHESLYKFLNYIKNPEERSKPKTDELIFHIDYIYFCNKYERNIKAKKVFDKLNVHPSGIGEAYACLGYALSRFHPKLYRDALENFQYSLKENPENGKVLLYLAKLKRKLNDDDYEEYLGKASELLPEDEEIKAEYLEIDKCKTINPTSNTSVLLKIAHYHIRQDQHGEARNILDTIHSIRPQPMSWYYFNLISKDPDYKLYCIKEAVKLDKFNPLISCNYALFLINGRKFEEAQQQLIITKNNTVSIPLKDLANLMLHWIQNVASKTHSLCNITRTLMDNEILAILQKDISVKCQERDIWIKCFLKLAVISKDKEIRQHCFKQLLALKSKITLHDLGEYSYDVCYFTQYFPNKERLEIFNQFGLRIIINNTEDFYGEEKLKTQKRIFHQSLYIVICLSKDFIIPDWYIEQILHIKNCRQEIMVLTEEIEDEGIPLQLQIFPRIEFKENESSVKSFFETMFRNN